MSDRTSRGDDGAPQITRSSPYVALAESIVRCFAGDPPAIWLLTPA